MNIDDETRAALLLAGWRPPESDEDEACRIMAEGLSAKTWSGPMEPGAMVRIHVCTDSFKFDGEVPVSKILEAMKP